MKFSANDMPEWLALDDYKREMSLEDLSYEIWVRANYVRSCPELGKPIFLTFSKNEPRDRGICALFSGALPVSLEDYLEFLKDSSHFRGQYAEQVNSWRSLEPIPALQVCQAEDSSIVKFLSLMPESVPRSLVQGSVADFFDETQPCSPNLECSDEEITGEFRKYLTGLRRREAELTLLAKGIANVNGILIDDPVWGGGKLLALFDLLYWKHAFSTLSDIQIGSAIWVDNRDGIRLDQRIARVGIPMIKNVFSLRIAKLLYREYASKNPKRDEMNN